MADYRDLPEWQALNRIWKAVPAQAREGVKEDFRLITDRIKALSSDAPAEKAPAQSAKKEAAAQNYLAGLSIEDRKYAVTLIAKGFDICAYIAALAADGIGEEEIFDCFVAERDVDEDDTDKVKRIIAAVRGAEGR